MGPIWKSQPRSGGIPLIFPFETQLRTRMGPVRYLSVNFGWGIVQNSIQAAYFSATQVTLHPFAAYYNITNGLTPKCYCILSNSMDHNHVAVHSFLKELLPKVKSLVSELKHIHYFSDGSAAQYKNR